MAKTVNKKNIAMVKRDMAMMKSKLPEKIEFEKFADQIDAIMNSSAKEMWTYISDKDIDPEIKIKATNTVVNIGRYIEVKRKNAIADDNDIEVDNSLMIVCD